MVSPAFASHAAAVSPSAYAGWEWQHRWRQPCLCRRADSPQRACFFLAVMKTGESGLTVFRLLTKENRWKWVQANARLVYKNGKPEYIIVTQRPLV